MSQRSSTEGKTSPAQEAAVPVRMSLRQQVNTNPTPPAPTADRKRLMDVHVTAYPGLLNTDLLPARALLADDFSEIDPTSYRPNHSVKNNNAGSNDGTAPVHAPVEMTTNQLTAKLYEMGLELRQNYSGGLNVSIEPRGYHTRYMAPPFDERSTYRLDYCQDEAPGFNDAARRSLLANYRKDWTEQEKADVDDSMKLPYLSLPLSYCRDKPTVYRRDYMPETERKAYRTLTHKSNLPDLGTSFAYSAYAYEDPRRHIAADLDVAKLKEPHSVLEKTHSPRDSFYAKSASASSGKNSVSSKEELEKLRAMRRATLQRSMDSRKKDVETVESIAENNENAIVIPGMRGQGFRRAPSGKDDYVYLPRDHFCHGHVDDF